MDNSLLFFTIGVLIAYWIYKRLTTEREGSPKSQGISTEKPLPIVGNILPLVLQKEGPNQFFEKIYKLFPNEKITGFYGFFGEYGFGINDPAFIKQITVKDFDSFVNRDRNENAIVMDNLLGRSVLMLRDQRWKDMRTMLSPIFTSSKMKYMYGLLTDCIEEFIKMYEDKAKSNGGSTEIETHDVFARITADGISTTALGFKGDCVINKDSKIYEIADALETDFTKPQVRKMMLAGFFPKIYEFLGMQMFRKSIHEFFQTNVLNEIQRRRDGKITRPDVIQLLVQAKEGQLKLEAGDAEELESTSAKGKKVTNWSDDDLVAQALVLFLGGFETTAMTMQSMSYELARNPEIQKTLIDEVDEMLEKLDGKTISYDQLNGMKFLEMVVNETLRKWPSFRAIARHCVKDCVLKDEDTGKTYLIKKGVDVIIPTGTIQNDPRYFPEPEKFDPYRFSDENKGKIQSGTYLPFGIGPRICIGSRYALLEAKLLIFSILTKFSIEKCDGTPEKLTFTTGNTGYKEKIYVSLKLRK